MSLFSDLQKARKAQRLERVNVGGYVIRKVCKDGELSRVPNRSYDGRTEWDFVAGNAEADRLAALNPGTKYMVVPA